MTADIFPPPPALTRETATDVNRCGALVRIYRRERSADGTTTVTTADLHPLDALAAVQRFPSEWAAAETTFAPWPAT